MAFGRKIANRILWATLIPPAVTLASGILIVSLRGDHLRLRDYAVGIALALIPTGVIVRLLVQPITTQLGQLRRSADRIERGDYQTRVSAGMDEELADVARAINHIADVGAQRESALREQNQALAVLNHRLEAVLNASNDGIAMLDCEGHFLLINRRFGELLGSRPNVLLHQAAEEASPILLERLARLSSRLAALLPGELQVSREIVEEIIVLDEPERGFLQMYTAPVQDEAGGNPSGALSPCGT